MRILRIPASIALSASVIAPALADDGGGGNAPRACWMVEDTAKSRAEVGHGVRDAKEAHGCREIEAIDKIGGESW
jgi:hypothetical protein